MTQEDIIRMAREVLLLDLRDNPNEDGIAQFIGTLSDFAALVAAAENEECEKLAEIAEPYKAADLIRARRKA